MLSKTSLAPLSEDTRSAATDLLKQARTQLETGVRALALWCAVDGTHDALDAQKLDACQPACYELAWASAELLAADIVLLNARGAVALDDGLALVFITDALVAVLQRLESIFLDLGVDRVHVLALAGSPALSNLRKTVASTSVLAGVGKAVADLGGDVGGVVLDDDVAMAQASFNRFATQQVSVLAEGIHRHDRIVPEALLQPLREMGVFGLSIPEAYGGSAPDATGNTLMMVAVTEALSKASLAAAGSLITRPEILSRALLAGGTEAQKVHWLPQIAMGNPLCGIAITEPDAGSDVASLMLRATRTMGGWLLNGAKTWCTFAGKAGLLMVVARTNPDTSVGHRGLSLMLVTKPAYEEHDFQYVQAVPPELSLESGQDRGKLTGRAIPTIGYRGMHSFDLAFENFFVPDDHVIGEAAGLGRGFYFTMAGMVGGRIQTAARACGVMHAALGAAAQYVCDRRVFGAPLIDFSLTQVKMARMAARFHACRQLTYEVARRLDAGGDRMEASLVKLLACRSAELVTREAMQLHGGMGYAEEMPVSRYFVDARVLSIFEGAEETLALKVVARSLLEAALRTPHVG